MPTLLEIFDVNEAVRAGVLYHGTDPDNCELILANNRISGLTSHKAFRQRTINNVTKPVPVGFRDRDIDKFESVSGVSLTRDPNFARRWKSGQGVVLCLDETKLRQRYRMVPYDYYGNRAEAEEFVVGSITDLSKYLISIEASEELVKDMAEDNELYAPGDGRYSMLMDHPLLRVNGKQWDGFTGRIAA